MVGPVIRFVPDGGEDLRQDVLYLGENSATADQAALAKAREMAAQGVDAEEIRQQTSWFQQQGRWFYEIDDTAFAQRGEAGRGEARTREPFFRYYAHPEVERAYPGMAGELMVGSRVRAGEFANFMEPNLEADEPGRPIVNLRERDYRGRLNVPLHELQHAIDLEEGVTTEFDRALTDQQSPVEQRAYSAEQRMRLTPEERRRIPPTFGGLLGRGILPPAMRYVPDRR